MQSIKLKKWVDADGVLRLEVPLGMANEELDVVLVVQSVDGTARRPESRGWPEGYFENVVGAVADFPDADGNMDGLNPSLDEEDDLRLG